MNSDITCTAEEETATKQECILLKKELEKTKQELYSCKRNVHLLEGLQREYQNEMEMLQSEGDSEKEALEHKIVQLEENNILLKLKYSEKNELAQKDFIQLQEENKGLKIEIELLKNTKTTTTSESDSINILYDEIMKLKEENFYIQEKFEELKISKENLEQQIVFLDETLSETKKEIDQLKENLVCKREELTDANDVIEKLNDEIICLKNELDTYKSQPENKFEKGNSLFAEVDDRRVYLQKTINAMKIEYSAMKHERTKLLRDISHLRLENQTLLQKWKSDITEIDEDHYTELRLHRDRITVLETLLENSKKELMTKQIPDTTDPFEGFQFFQDMIKAKNNQIEELQQQLRNRTLTETLLSKALSDANDEKRKWKLEAATKQNELQILRNDESIQEKKYNAVDSKQTRSPPVKPTLKKAVTRRDNSQKVKQLIAHSSKNNPFEFHLFPNDIQTKLTSVEENLVLSNDEITSIVTEEKNLSVIVLDDSSIEISDTSDKAIKTEQSDSQILNSSEETNTFVKQDVSIEERVENEEREITENIFTAEALEHASSLCTDLENDKENIDVICKAVKEKSEFSKKVTFTANTVSPKTTGLRKCKKVIVCKPMVFK